MNDTGNRIIAAIVLVLLLIGAWYLGHTTVVSEMAGNDDTSGYSSSTAQTSTTGSTTNAKPSASVPTTQAIGDAVEVANQPAGMAVSVSSVTLGDTGWVAVRGSDGRILGAGRFDAGTSKNVVVDLLRGTISGQRYQVLLYVDDGDKQFDFHKDTLVTNSDGSVAGTTFSAE